MSAQETAKTCFVIMQIGNEQLDDLYDSVYEPVIREAGLIPIRIDRDNTGDLLAKEIIEAIESSEIIVADLTGARPNCYYEVGYAMGLGKRRNLILTVHEDHHHTSPNYRQSGHRVHFDLEGFDLLRWDFESKSNLANDLKDRLARRLAIIRENSPARTPEGELLPRFDEEILEGFRQESSAGLQASGFNGYMEAFASIAPLISTDQTSLLDIVRESQIMTFGWPIGVQIDQNGMRPKPTAGGIKNSVSRHMESYDYWAANNDGSFYMLRSLFEDLREPNPPQLFFNTRIVQVTELLLFLARVYERLEVSKSTSVSVSVNYGGLAGRRMFQIGNRFMRRDMFCEEERATIEVLTTVGGLESNLVELVDELTKPMFVLFDFFDVGEAVLREIVNAFVEGRVA